MFAIALALMTSSPDTVTLAQARGEAEALAPVLLPADVAGRIVGATLRRQWLPGQVYGALLWEQPTVANNGLCQREVHWVYLGNSNLPGDDGAPGDAPLTVGERGSGIHYAISYPQAATNETCGLVSGWFGTNERTRAAELRSIQRLTQAVRQASGADPLPFEVICEGEEPDACRDARAALANLPLDRLLGVQMRNTEYRSEPTNNGVRVRYMQPVEDDRWPEAEVSFDMSGAGGRSWTVVLKGIERLEEVQMQRSTIIRH